MRIHRHSYGTVHQRFRDAIAHICRSDAKRDGRILSQFHSGTLGLCLDKLEIDLTITGGTPWLSILHRAAFQFRSRTGLSILHDNFHRLFRFSIIPAQEIVITQPSPARLIGMSPMKHILVIRPERAHLPVIHAIQRRVFHRQISHLSNTHRLSTGRQEGNATQHG